jgi:hypothetical protein
MVRLIELALICMSFEELAMRAGHKVLMEVDDNVLLITAQCKNVST